MASAQVYEVTDSPLIKALDSLFIKTGLPGGVGFSQHQNITLPSPAQEYLYLYGY